MQFQRRSRAITPEALAWVWSLSKRTPQEFGYAESSWTVALLVVHVRRFCRASGHPTLAVLTYGRLSQLLACEPAAEAQGEYSTRV